MSPHTWMEGYLLFKHCNWIVYGYTANDLLYAKVLLDDLATNSIYIELNDWIDIIYICIYKH